jgi:hypothetical protein
LALKEAASAAAAAGFEKRRFLDRFLGGQTMHKTRTATLALVGAGFALAFAPLAAYAAGAFEGVWKVTDTGGQPFEITLSEGGAAKANRGEGLTGTWKQDGDSAVITWSTGWTTKITKEGDHYKKTAFGKDKPATGEPTNSSEAQKVK